MVESFYHMKSIPDFDYNSYLVTLDELKKGRYKGRVNTENRNRDYTKFAVDRRECNTVILQNIGKAWEVSDNKHFNINTDIVDELNLPDSVNLLNKQLLKLKREGLLLVLCTCIFYIVDYNPKYLLV